VLILDVELFTQQDKKHSSFIKGILITLFISVFASMIAKLPLLSVLGQLVIAILIGMGWKASIGIPVQLMIGVSFASKKLLRVGIILLGMKLNLVDIYQAGFSVFLIAVINVTFTLIVVFFLARLFKVERNLAILTACGTAICGAAAVVAISSQIKARENDTAIAVATVCLIGTAFTILYTLFYSKFGLTSVEFGIFSGGTLHEIAHVIAAAAPAGSDAVDMAVIVKLTRVALLIPVAFVISLYVNKDKAKKGKSPLPIPWFIVGFLVMSFIHTLGIFSSSFTSNVVTIAYVLIGMAMAGLGINIQIKVIKQKGKLSIIASLVGSVLLAVLGYLLMKLSI
jgi:uncharacterized integral membrane protein (TIGR00698 family)